MKQYFEVKIKTSKFDENGEEKAKSVNILVDAMSFTEAEAKVTKEDGTSHFFEIQSIKKSKVVELYDSCKGDNWFKVKAKFELIDDNDKKSKTSELYLIKTDTINGANDAFVEFMKNTVADYEICSISESNIESVY